MGCGSCGTTTGGAPSGCKSNGTCGTSGCNKLNTYDWFKDIDLPENYTPFDIIEIRFKGSRKEFFKNVNNLELYTGDAVVLESDLGHDIGHVSLTGELVRLQLRKAELTEASPNIKKIYRIASEADKEKYTEYKAKEPSTLERARTIALELKLEMKLSDIEFQADGKKVIFFYTAEERVDFRELIKRYATDFKTRIEMRQISYREEASRLGGIGSCGRELCCSTWLTDYKIVNISAARFQNLSINMLKLSGQCGRLKCCLNYELDTYMESLGDFPGTEKVTVNTKIGTASLQKIDILKKMMWFAYQDKPGDWIPIEASKVTEIIEKNKRGELPETLVDRPLGAEIMSKTTYKVDDMLEDSNINRMEDKNKERKQGERNFRDKNRPDNRNKNQNPNNPNRQGNDRPRNPNNPNPNNPNRPNNNRPDNRPGNPNPNNPNRPNNDRPRNPNQDNRPNNNNRNNNRPNNNPNRPIRPPGNPPNNSNPGNEKKD
ncbi:MAG: regulatory iron-sulfur-containing complex subunit RicT [Bacteroidia bacterium]